MERALSASLLPLLLALTPAPLAEHQAACAGKDGWSDPAPPIRVFGNVYDVGTCGIVALLVVGPRGHVLIDGATAEAAPGIARNIERLGLQLSDVKLILGTHEHVDHAGGLAALKRLTGASLRLSPAATKVLATGKVDPADPQLGVIEPPPVARPGPPLRNGETVAVGALRLTAHFTPGHVMGGTSWTWRSCAGRRCVRIAYADSLSAVSADGYRFTRHPERIAALRRSVATVAALPCDLLITPHPSSSDLYPRLTGDKPLIDPTACGAYAARAESGLKARLTKERLR